MKIGASFETLLPVFQLLGKEYSQVLRIIHKYFIFKISSIGSMSIQNNELYIGKNATKDFRPLFHTRQSLIVFFLLNGVNFLLNFVVQIFCRN